MQPLAPGPDPVLQNAPGSSTDGDIHMTMIHQEHVENIQHEQNMAYHQQQQNVLHQQQQQNVLQQQQNVVHSMDPAVAAHAMAAVEQASQQSQAVMAAAAQAVTHAETSAVTAVAQAHARATQAEAQAQARAVQAESAAAVHATTVELQARQAVEATQAAAHAYAASMEQQVKASSCREVELQREKERLEGELAKLRSEKRQTTPPPRPPRSPARSPARSHNGTDPDGGFATPKSHASIATPAADRQMIEHLQAGQAAMMASMEALTTAVSQLISVQACPPPPVQAQAAVQPSVAHTVPISPAPAPRVFPKEASHLHELPHHPSTPIHGVRIPVHATAQWLPAPPPPPPEGSAPADRRQRRKGGGGGDDDSSSSSSSSDSDGSSDGGGNGGRPTETPTPPPTCWICGDWHDSAACPYRDQLREDMLLQIVCPRCNGPHALAQCPFHAIQLEHREQDRRSQVSTTSSSLPILKEGEEEADVVRIKDLDNNFKVPSTPENSAKSRGWVNLMLSRLAAFDKTDRNVLWRWGMKAVRAKSVSELKDSEGLARTDRALALKLLEATKHGRLSRTFQSMFEKARVTDEPPVGRVMLFTILQEFSLDRDANSLITQSYLLKLRPKGQEVTHLETFRQEIDLILSQLPEEDHPSQGTLKTFLFEALEAQPLMASAIRKWKEAKPSSRRRSFEWLYEKMQVEIRYARESRNRAALNKAFDGRTIPGMTGKTGKKEKKEKEKEKKKKKGKKEKEKEEDQVPGAPGAPKVKAKPKKKPKATPGDSTPVSSMTPEQKASIPCMFFPTNTCWRNPCPFLHDQNNLHPNPKTAPKAKASAKTGKAAVRGAVAAVTASQADAAWFSSCHSCDAPAAPGFGEPLACTPCDAPDAPGFGQPRNVSNLPSVEATLAQEDDARSSPSMLRTVIGSVARVLPKKLMTFAAAASAALDPQSVPSLASAVQCSQSLHVPSAVTFADRVAQAQQSLHTCSTVPAASGGDTCDQFSVDKNGDVFIEWIQDTGAGRNMGGLKSVPKELRHLVSNATTEVSFHTGGGTVDGCLALGVDGELSGANQTYLLNGSPWAQATGIQVNKHGNAFLWIPDDSGEAKPFTVRKEHMKHLKIRCPKRYRRYADKLHENVPFIREKVKLQNVNDHTEVWGTPYSVGGSSSSSAGQPPGPADDELNRSRTAPAPTAAQPAPAPAEPAQVAPAVQQQPAPAEPAQAAPAVQPQGRESAEDRQRREARSVEHMRSHYPANPFCEVCRIAKTKSTAIARKPGGAADKQLDPPKEPKQHMHVDDVIVAKGDGNRGKSAGGHKSLFVIRDGYSGARVAFPQSGRTELDHQICLKKFTGPAHVAKSDVMVFSDQSDAITGAVQNLGWHPETSLPNRFPHNVFLESDIPLEKATCRAAMWQSGFPHELWHLAYPFSCLTLSFDCPSLREPDKSQWESLTGRPFEGPRHLFGQLVFYRVKTGLPLDPNLAPALFIGWRLDSGLRYRDVVQVLDYTQTKDKVGHWWKPIDVPIAELFLQEGQPVFPFAERRNAALRTLSDASPLPVIETPDLPFQDDALPPAPAPVPRGVYITIERIIEHGTTPGCKACTGDSVRHTAACRERFAKLYPIADRRSPATPGGSPATPGGSPATPAGSAAALAPSTPAVQANGSAAAMAPLTTHQPPHDSHPSISPVIEPALVSAAVIAPTNLQPTTAQRETSNSELPAAACDPASADSCLKPDSWVSVDCPCCSARFVTNETSLPGGPLLEAPGASAPTVAATTKASKGPKWEKREQQPAKENKSRDSRATLKGYGVLFEFACAEDSCLGKVSVKYGVKHARLFERLFNLRDPAVVERLAQEIRDNPGADLWGSIPCTVWTSWQEMAKFLGGDEYATKLGKRREASRKLLRTFLYLAELVIQGGGRVAYEWPKGARDGWAIPELVAFIEKHSLQVAHPTGCACGMVDDKGHPQLKTWKVVTNDHRLADSLNALACQHPPGFKHSPIEGKYTAASAFYPPKLCETIINSLYPDKCHSYIPSMSCIPSSQSGHREKETPSSDFVDVPSQHPIGLVFESDPSAAATAPGMVCPLAVTRLLDRKEWLGNEKALAALRKEADGLEKAGTWDLESVREKLDVAAEARRSNKSVHFGQLMSIVSEKFAELKEELRVLKGRIVFRGDIVRDEHGAIGVFQDLSANPTSVQGLNNNLAYGRMPGHRTTAADAIKAYVQSLLKSKNATWVSLPPELWPRNWKSQFTKPVVLLIKSLYGHPESGAHWERHLTDILVRELGGQPIGEFPSSYWFPASKLLLTVYVDDFTLSGPSEAHDSFWEKLKLHVDLEEVTDLDRVLGRHHDEVTVDGKPALSFNMSEYAEQACELYESLPGAKPLKHAPTPFVADGSLIPADDDIKGELAPNACKVLMKDLWLGRLARPDIIKPIGLLATQVQKWTKNCDKQLYRLMCYLKASKDYRLVGRVNDPADKLVLRLYVDADFAGDRLDAVSTNGGYLVLYGPNTFFPLAWVSKKQTATSRSTTESEVISLAYSLFSEALPTLTLWETLLGRSVELQVMEDNQATIRIVKNGFSAKLRHISRTHKIDLSSLSEQFRQANIKLDYIDTKEQAADIFTKSLEPAKWGAALDMLSIYQVPPPLKVRSCAAAERHDPQCAAHAKRHGNPCAASVRHGRSRAALGRRDAT